MLSPFFRFAGGEPFFTVTGILFIYFFFRCFVFEYLLECIHYQACVVSNFHHVIVVCIKTFRSVNKAIFVCLSNFVLL